MSPIQLQAVVARVRGEFLEMPGLRLTLPQAARLWGLDQTACRLVVDILIQAGFLRWTAEGVLAGGRI